jgi:peptide/nickel transport system permease protein
MTSETARARTQGTIKGQVTPPTALTARRPPAPFWRRFLRHRAAALGGLVLLAMVVAAILAPLLAPYSWSAQSVANRWQAPSREHLLGTDELGRDILSRLIWGARFSLSIGFGAVLISFSVGVLIGTVSGYYRNLDIVVQRLVDVMLAFPSILLAIAIVAALGPGFVNTIIVIGVTEVPGFIRLARSSVLSIREREFVTAARALGARDGRIMLRHVLPSMVSPIVVFASLRIATALLTGATLSFLGLGVPPPRPEWGAMISTARNSLRIAPHTFLIPTVVLFVAVMAANFLGDGLRDTLDPQIRD